MNIPQYVDLGRLIKALAAADPARPVRWGFGRPMSYRGDYTDVAFSPKEKTTVGAMLMHARSALGQTFTGYKGGEFTMHGGVDCHIDEYGEAGGDRIGPTLLRYWLEDQ